MRKNIIHYFNITHKKSNQNLGFYSKDALLSDRIKHLQKEQSDLIPKIQKIQFLNSPESEVFEKMSEGILSWIHSKRATTIRPINSQNGVEMRYYRNIYHENQKFPLYYDDMHTLLIQILRGAFTWIVDSHNMQDSVPCSPYVATVDLDVRDIEYTAILERVFDYYSYCKDIVGLEPILTHSGNSSFHFKFFLGEIDASTTGQLLPKLVSWETYYRRRKNELKITYIKNAIDLLTLAYNHYTELEPVACNFKKYSRIKHKEYFDNRTGIQQGARVPGSWHHKSNMFSRVFDYSKIPSSLSELHALMSQDYIIDHPKVLLRPAISKKIMDQNTKRLLNFTNEYYTKNFNKLVYEERIYNE